MASELAICYTPMHFMWGVKSGATPAINGRKAATGNRGGTRLKAHSFHQLLIPNLCNSYIYFEGVNM